VRLKEPRMPSSGAALKEAASLAKSTAASGGNGEGAEAEHKVSLVDAIATALTPLIRNAGETLKVMEGDFKHFCHNDIL